MTKAQTRQRLDKWLWYARFFKTRSMAAKVVGAGRVRVNGVRTAKPAQAVAPGDVLTFPQSRQVRVVRITALAERRGPAPEAQALYCDLSETPDPKVAMAPNPAYDEGGRPDKRQRRALDRTRRQGS